MILPCRFLLQRGFLLFSFFFFFYFLDHVVSHCGVMPCTGLELQSQGNFTSIPEPSGTEFNILNAYLSSVLNKSRAIEEAIYSDILNNLRTLLKPKFDTKKTKKYPKEEEEGKRRFVPENVTVEGEYLLGYSGSVFGSHQPLPGVVEVRENDGGVDPRKKRSVVHLYNMVLCTTGCNPFAYKGYGCYCGFLGSGFVVDGIDSCCKMHDWCYNSAGCPMFLEYFIPYLWKCYHRQPLCAIDHGYYGGPSSCAQRLCECDRQLALCLRRYPCPSSKALCTSSPWRLLQNILMF